MRYPALLAALALAGCAHAVPVPEDGLSRTGLGRTVAVGGPRVTPLRVLEDSRCPPDVRCVWAGRMRLQVRVDLGSGSQTRELTLGEPIPVADGTLELVEVWPDKGSGGDYRFGFRFMGGI
jgi:hypothetical protein